MTGSASSCGGVPSLILIVVKNCVPFLKEIRSRVEATQTRTGRALKL